MRVLKKKVQKGRYSKRIKKRQFYRKHLKLKGRKKQGIKNYKRKRG